MNRTLNFYVKPETQNQAVLVLSDGSRFRGYCLKPTKATVGKIKVITDLVGFQEHLSDQQNSNKILLFTTPHVGITGANDTDANKTIQSVGLIMRDPARKISNFRAERSLFDDLVEQETSSIFGVDTRKIARLSRNKTLFAGIFSGTDLKLSEEEQFEIIKNYEGSEV